MRGDVQNEWDGTKQHDVVFLLTIDPPDAQTLLQIRKDAEAAAGPGAKPSPDKLHGLVRVRGCEVIEVCFSAFRYCTYFVESGLYIGQIGCSKIFFKPTVALQKRGRP